MRSASSIKFLMCFIFSLLALAYSQAQQVEVITENVEKPAFENKSYLVVKSLLLKPGFTVSASANGTWYAKVHPNAVVPTTPSAGQNFVQSETILTDGITTEAQIRNLTVADKGTAFSYSDGLGRTIQNVSAATSPNLNDQVQPSYFDAQGRPSRQYLPYTPPSGTAGSFRPNALNEQASFYNSPPAKVAGDTRSYSEAVFESSPLNRVFETRATGADWASKPATTTFTFTAPSNLFYDPVNNVSLWQVVNGLPYAGSNYPYGSLTITQSSDEDGNAVHTYTDFLGRVVMKRAQVSQNEWAQTSYVYDYYGKPLFIIPPEAPSNSAPDQAYVDLWCFQYQYDEYQRAIGTKAPGAGWVYTIYDKWDRPVLTQDASQRAANQWSFVKYDDLNRPVLTGIFTTTESRAALTNALATVSNGQRYEVRNATAVGYTLGQTFPASISENELLSIVYYDDYGFLNNAGWDAEGNSFSFISEPGYTGTVFNNVKDLITGGKVRVLNSATWLNSITYYDRRYRPLQAIAENQFGKTDRATTGYHDFSGKVLKVKQVHQKANLSYTLQERYSYDLSGRLLNTWHQVNTQPEVLISALEYNEMGQVVKKKLHVASGSALQAVDYRYNARGWLTQVNYTSPEGGDPTDYFGMELAYQNSIGTGNSGKYNGLVTAMRWKHDTGNEQQVYNYGYDPLGRLTSATYKETTGSGWTEALDRYNENAAYSPNGNITSLTRNGELSGATVNIDQLGYTYTGNQLTGVTDSAPTAYKNMGFKDGPGTGTDYTYDVNGNLTYDQNKGMTITYNAIDLPQQITFADNTSLEYMYDASGAKLKEIYYNTSHQELRRTEYNGAFVYIDGTLACIQHGEGRYVTPAGDAGAGIYQYYLRDHLGSVRVVLTTQPSMSSMSATFEDENLVQEKNAFLDYDASLRTGGELFNHTKGRKGPGKALRLNGAGKGKKGLARSLSVMPGDTVRLQVFAKYLEKKKEVDAKGLVTNVVSTVTTGISTGAVDGATASLPGEPVTLPFGAALDKSSEEEGNAPRAYLNWIFFNKNLVMKNGGYRRISEKAKEDGTNVEHERLADSLVITEPGYLYVFLSNEEAQPTEVYFDDLTISVTEGPVIQVNDYYPYGMTAYTLLREGEEETKEKFQGKEYDPKTGWADHGARMYDPVLGRWFAVDPAGQFVSPYLAMGNNPVMGVDPDGQYVLVDDLIAAAVGGVVNLAVNAFQGNLSGHGLWEGIGRGFAAFGAGAVGGLGAIYPEFGGWVWGGAVVGGTNAWLSGATSAQDIAMGAGIGVVSSVAGGAIGQALAPTISSVTSGITSPVLRGAIGGAIGGTVVGGTLGGFGSLATGGDFWQGAGQGALTGFATGAVAGGVSAGVTAKVRGFNPWTGKPRPLTPILSSESSTPLNLNKISLVNDPEIQLQDSKQLPMHSNLTQGNSKMGLDHIVLRHFEHTGAQNVSRFNGDIGARQMRDFIQSGLNNPSRIITQSGSKIILEFNAGHYIGTTQTGAPTSWIRVIFTSNGTVITSYPVPNPNSLILGR